jgi:hypothetical protein
MVDNINLNKTSPLLSSTERIKRVDRKSRNSHQSPFKGAQQGKQKKKKKKNQGQDKIPSEVTASRNSIRYAKVAGKRHEEKEGESKSGRSKKIIDIRV